MESKEVIKGEIVVQDEYYLLRSEAAGKYSGFCLIIKSNLDAQDVIPTFRSMIEPFGLDTNSMFNKATIEEFDGEMDDDSQVVTVTRF